jgi:tetratricopeptide (TPR) repeat protein
MKVGRALEERGLYEEALLLYQTLNQQFPDFSMAYEAAGDIYFSQHKDIAKARAAYQAALETLPRDATLSAEQKAYRQNYLTEDIAALT